MRSSRQNQRRSRRDRVIGQMVAVRSGSARHERAYQAALRTIQEKSHQEPVVGFTMGMQVGWFAYRRKDGERVMVEYHGEHPGIPDDADPAWVEEQRNRPRVRVVSIDAGPPVLVVNGKCPGARAEGRE